ncbi:hypothetical protein J4Q44_G00079430 [Coregonus suidteri]|uniref:Uncharacterized protein n=1 Tax=Coregonus suidteri TaxID=861788 RepID=A0AAN8M7W0_9TELE
MTWVNSGIKIESCWRQNTGSLQHIVTEAEPNTHRLTLSVLITMKMMLTISLLLSVGFGLGDTMSIPEEREDMNRPGWKIINKCGKVTTRTVEEFDNMPPQVKETVQFFWGPECENDNERSKREFVRIGRQISNY